MSCATSVRVVNLFHWAVQEHALERNTPLNVTLKTDAVNLSVVITAIGGNDFVSLKGFTGPLTVSYPLYISLWVLSNLRSPIWLTDVHIRCTFTSRSGQAIHPLRGVHEMLTIFYREQHRSAPRHDLSYPKYVV